MNRLFACALFLGLSGLTFGCNKASRVESGAFAKSTLGSTSDAAPAPEAPPAPQESLVYKTPSKDALDKADMYGKAGEELAAKAGEATNEQRQIVEKALDAQLAAFGCTGDKAKDQISGKLFPRRPASYSKTVDTVLGKLIANGKGIDEAGATDLATMLLSQIKSIRDAQAKELEQQKHTDPSGRIVEKVEGQLPPKLEPAKSIAGDWQSVREVDEANTYSINHNDNYFEKLMVKPDRTLVWIVYRNGVEQYRSDYKYSYNAKSGELDLSYPNGAAYQTKEQGGALQALTNALQADEIYIKTPGVERMKVFKQLGG